MRRDQACIPPLDSPMSQKIGELFNVSVGIIVVMPRAVLAKKSHRVALMPGTCLRATNDGSIYTLIAPERKRAAEKTKMSDTMSWRML